MKIDTVIFDLDGTLLDTTDGVIESAVFAARQMGYADLPYTTMLEFVGPPIQNSFKKHYGCTVEKAQMAANIFREYYKYNALLKAKPYPGIFELCDKLRHAGKKLAVATYKREDYAVTLLKHFGFDKYIDVMRGADNNNQLTKTDIINCCLKETDSVPENTILVGDTAHDAEGAQRSKVFFIAVTYGFGFRDIKQTEMYPCYGVANSPREICQIILRGQS